MIENRYQLALQNALEELKANLAHIESAKNQIETAKNTANSVITSIDGFETAYAKHLETTSQLVSQFLSAANQQQLLNLQQGAAEIANLANDIHTEHKKQLAENTQILQQAADTNHKNLQQTLQQTTSQIELAVANSKQVAADIADAQKNNTQKANDLTLEIQKLQQQHLQQLSAEFANRFQQLADELTSRTDKSLQHIDTHTQKILNELTNTAQKLDKFSENAGQLSQTTFQKLDSHVDAATHIYNKHHREIQSYLDNNRDLLEAIEFMERQVRSVDFPIRLERIESGIQTYQQNIQSTQQQILLLERDLKEQNAQTTLEIRTLFDKQNQQLSTLRIILGVAIGFIVLLGILLIFK
jgi:DNA repair exonuclease SbcCD ATPase subunit